MTSHRLEKFIQNDVKTKKYPVSDNSESRNARREVRGERANWFKLTGRLWSPLKPLLSEAVHLNAFRDAFLLKSGAIYITITSLSASTHLAILP